MASPSTATGHAEKPRTHKYTHSEYLVSRPVSPVPLSGPGLHSLRLAFPAIHLVILRP